MESDGKDMSGEDWELPPEEAYDKVLKAMKDDIKRYLGYPPHNGTENQYKRNPEYLKMIQTRYGRTLPELLERTKMADLGSTAPPQIRHTPTNAMLRAMKRIYGIENLYFWQDQRTFLVEWLCSTKQADAKGTLDFNEFDRLIKVLDGQIKMKSRLPDMYKVTFIDTGNKHAALDSLREELLIIRLSGLLR